MHKANHSPIQSLLLTVYTVGSGEAKKTLPADVTVPVGQCHFKQMVLQACMFLEGEDLESSCRKRGHSRLSRIALQLPAGIASALDPFLPIGVQMYIN